MKQFIILILTSLIFGGSVYAGGIPGVELAVESNKIIIQEGRTNNSGIIILDGRTNGLSRLDAEKQGLAPGEYVVHIKSGLQNNKPWCCLLLDAAGKATVLATHDNAVGIVIAGGRVPFKMMTYAGMGGGTAPKVGTNEQYDLNRLPGNVNYLVLDTSDRGNPSAAMQHARGTCRGR